MQPDYKIIIKIGNLFLAKGLKDCQYKWFIGEDKKNCYKILWGWFKQKDGV